MARYTVEVTYEWVRQYVIHAEDESAAVEHAIADAKEDISDEFEAGPPSASDFEAYALD